MRQDAAGAGGVTWRAELPTVEVPHAGVMQFVFERGKLHTFVDGESVDLPDYLNSEPGAFLPVFGSSADVTRVINAIRRLARSRAKEEASKLWWLARFFTWAKQASHPVTGVAILDRLLAHHFWMPAGQPVRLSSWVEAFNLDPTDPLVAQAALLNKLPHPPGADVLSAAGLIYRRIDKLEAGLFGAAGRFRDIGASEMFLFGEQLMDQWDSYLGLDPGLQDYNLATGSLWRGTVEGRDRLRMQDPISLRDGTPLWIRPRNGDSQAVKCVLDSAEPADEDGQIVTLDLELPTLLSGADVFVSVGAHAPIPPQRKRSRWVADRYLTEDKIVRGVPVEVQLAAI